MERDGSDGRWHVFARGVYGAECDGILDVVFAATWETTPNPNSGYWNSYSTELKAQIPQNVVAEIEIVPARGEIYEQGRSGDYWRGTLNLSYYKKPSVNITGVQVLCAGPNGSWQPCGVTDNWKIDDQSPGPRQLSCGESMQVFLLFREFYKPGLVIFRTDSYQDIVIEVIAVEPLPG
jgi:hypothetical protein